MRRVLLAVIAAFVATSTTGITQAFASKSPPPCVVSKPHPRPVAHRPCRPRPVVSHDWKRLHWLEEQLALAEAAARQARQDADEAKAEVERLLSVHDLIVRKAEQDVKAAQDKAKIEIGAANDRATRAIAEADKIMKAAEHLSDVQRKN